MIINWTACEFIHDYTKYYASSVRGHSFTGQDEIGANAHDEE